jgi:hypothetical protein
MARNLNESVVINVVDSNGDITNVLNVNDFVINNPYNVNINSVFLPNTEPMDLNIFFETASKLIKDAQEREAVHESKIVKIVEEYPPENMDEYGNEVITFKVVERKPGMMNTKGTGRPHRKATFSHQEIRPDLPNKVITVESRPVDHVIEFNCWALSNKLANKRAIWLEKLFINSAFAFEVKGAERFFFKERLSDAYMTINGQRVFSRPLRFFLRFREFDAKADTMLRNILVEIGTLPQN